MSSVAIPQQEESKIGRTPGAEEGKEGGDPLSDFRELAQKVQQLQAKYPEFTEGSLAILKEIKKAMSQVSGNPQRTPEKQAPPLG